MTEAAEQLPHHFLETPQKRQIPNLVGVELQEVAEPQELAEAHEFAEIEITEPVEQDTTVSDSQPKAKIAGRGIKRYRGNKMSIDQTPRGRSGRRRGNWFNNSCASCSVQKTGLSFEAPKGCQNCRTPTTKTIVPEDPK